MHTKTAMTARERSLAVERGRPADRRPVFYWLNPHACCKLSEQRRPSIKALTDLKGYQSPDMRDDSRYDNFRKLRRKYPDKCLAAGVFGPFAIPREACFGSALFLDLLGERWPCSIPAGIR